MNTNSMQASNAWAMSPNHFQQSKQPTEQWEPGFEAERCVVVSKLGPFRKVFLRPEKFTPRFFHSLYPLTVENWHILDQVGLYDDFCMINIELTIRFQATFDYVSKNVVELEHINTNIKSTYDDLVRNIPHTQLLNLPDARWVETGLAKVEKAIALAVSELLLMHDIQAISSCVLAPTFKSFPDIRFKEEAAQLLVLKKRFELNNKQQQEAFVQEQKLEQQKLAQEQARLKHVELANQIALEKQSQEAEYQKQQLLKEEAQQRERFEIELRLQAERLKQQLELDEMALKAKFALLEKQQLMERELEAKTLDDKIAHQLKVKEKELAAKVKLFESEKQSWNKAKEQTQLIEIKQKQRQKQLQINAEIENKAFLYRQQLLLEEQLRSEKRRELDS